MSAAESKLGAMARYFIALLLLVSLFGCKKTEPAATAPAPGPMPAPSKVTGEGPKESELAKTLDLDMYPGAKLLSSKIATAGAEKRYHVTMETKDAPSRISDYYRGLGFMSIARGNAAQIMGKTPKGNLVIIDVLKKGDSTEMAIKVSPAAGHK